MGKFSPVGALLFHITMISFGLVIFTILKNFDFTDYKNSPVLTVNQISFISICIIIGICVIIAFLIYGYFVKTPKHYTRAGAAVVLIIIGLGILFGMWYHDQIIGNEQVIGPTEMIFMIFGALIIIMGSYAYIALKFPDEAVMKYFKEAVKEEIRNRREEERQWQMYERQMKAEERKKRVRVKAKKKAAKTSKAAVEVAEVAPMDTSTASVSSEPAVRNLTVTEAEMSPLGAGGLTVIKCSNCGKPMKLTSQERPLAIKCPYCEEIGVIKE
jgi:DNA-directed RNA polymerase subunit RPC12/RpoP